MEAPQLPQTNGQPKSGEPTLENLIGRGKAASAAMRRAVDQNRNARQTMLNWIQLLTLKAARMADEYAAKKNGKERVSKTLE